MILEACSYTIDGLFLHKGHGLCARPSKCQKRLRDTDLQSFRQKGGNFEWTGGNYNQGGRVKRHVGTFLRREPRGKPLVYLYIHGIFGDINC